MSEFDQFRRQLAELGSSLNDLEYSDAREKFDHLQKIFEVNLSTIPDHEQKLANREIHDLHKKIEKVGKCSELSEPAGDPLRWSIFIGGQHIRLKHLFRVETH